MQRRWFISRTNPEYIHYISKAASISPILARVMINRGIKTADEINNFLYPSVTGLSDPYELPDMKAAVERIKAALSHNERVLVHGDYDADGLTATAIMAHSLKKIGLDVEYFIPNRMVHGYGFNPPSVDIAKKFGVKLIITVDCGITSFDAANYAKQEGIDVIITDHHEPMASRQSLVNSEQSDYSLNTIHYSLPEAVAVVNPKLGTRNPELSILSGAGIAFKIAQALAAERGLHFSMDDSLSLLDLAALGTIADVVPLTGENRFILKEGMKYINNACRPGIKSLKKIAGIEDREVKSGTLAFSLIPRINAAGRIADSSDVVELLTTDSDDRADEIAQWLNRLNSERQQIEEEIFQEVMGRLDTKDTSSVIVLASETWHQGVIGIVASRVAEQFYRPVVIFSIEDGMAKGSARSIPSFDICNAFSDCSEMLTGFGGHRQAAGVRLEAGRLESFEKKLCSLFDSAEDIELTPLLKIDADINLSDISFSLIKELGMLEPLGYGNPEPLFASKMLDISSCRIVGNNHLKMKLSSKSRYIDAIGFDMGGYLENLDISASVDAVFTPAVNEWNGGRYLQLILKALRPSV